MVVIDPDDGDEEIADRVAHGGRPQRKKRSEVGLVRRLQLEHQNGDDHREHRVGERGQPLRSSLSRRHPTLLWTSCPSEGSGWFVFDHVVAEGLKRCHCLINVPVGNRAWGCTMRSFLALKLSFDSRLIYN